VTDSEDQDTPHARRGIPARIGICLIVMLTAYLGSIWHSWRFSAVRDPAPRWWSRWYGLVLVWAVGTLLTWPLTDRLSTLYRLFYVPSEAMAPTLGINDRFLADMHMVDAPRRGDVVIVHTGTVDYVKRIAALPGDRIAMRDGVVVLNGRPVTQTLTERVKARDVDNVEVERRTLTERFPGEEHAHQIIDMGPSDGDDRAEIRLGAGQYFLLGDNRDRSADSRFGVLMSGLGVVDRARITGHVLFVYWRRGAGLDEIRPYIP
jgi:signal peptidase I